MRVGCNGGQLSSPPSLCLGGGYFCDWGGVGGGGLHFRHGIRRDGDETPAVWEGSTDIREGTERGIHCQEGTISEGGQEDETEIGQDGGTRYEEDGCREISDLNSHFRVALCCSLFCTGVEFESKYFWSA